jgi:hypothetical protein
MRRVEAIFRVQHLNIGVYGAMHDAARDQDRDHRIVFVLACIVIEGVEYPRLMPVFVVQDDMIALAGGASVYIKMVTHEVLSIAP